LKEKEEGEGKGRDGSLEEFQRKVCNTGGRDSEKR